MSDQDVEQLALSGATVTALPLGTFTAPFDMLHGMSPAEAQRELAAQGHDADGTVHAYAFAIELSDRLIMIDAGMGAGSALPGLQPSMMAAGIDGSAADTVLLTHLHPDHANGLLGSELPRAQVVVPNAEIAFARDRRAIDAAGAFVQRDYERAADVLDAVGDRLVTLDTWRDGVVTIEPLPGHSPGHTGYRLRTGDVDVLFVGDLMHFASLQSKRPEVSVRPDFDPDAAAATRRRVLDAAAERGTVLAGAHLGDRGFRRVRRVRPGFTLH